MKQGKEKKEVLSHLANLSIGYSDEAGQKIVGFLLGVGIVQRGEKFEISYGRIEIKHFYDWFYNLHSSKIKGKIVEIINEESNNVTDELLKLLAPLIEGEVDIPKIHGVPKHFVIE